jgi:hypothetical protein
MCDRKTALLFRTYSTLQVNEVHPLPLARGGLGRGISVPHKVEICCMKQQESKGR